MRHLSKSEQKWTRQIVDGFNSSTTGYIGTTILWGYLLGNGNEIDLDFEHSQILFYKINDKAVLCENEYGYPSTSSSFDYHDAIDIHRIITEQAILLKLLRDEGYIYLIEGSVSKKSKNYLSDDTKKRPKPITMDFDKELMSVLCDYHNHTLICHQSLIEYVQNGYLEYEEKVHKDDLQISEKHARKNLRSAYLVGILSPIIAGLFGFLTAWLVPVTINKKQVESLSAQIDKQINGIDSIKSAITDKPDSTALLLINEELSNIQKELQPISTNIKHISRSIISLKETERK